MYPHLNLGKWVFPLVNTQQKLDSVVDANKKTKWNLSESDSENEIIKFQRLIVIESQEETSLAKLSHFLIERNYLQLSKPLNYEKH